MPACQKQPYPTSIAAARVLRRTQANAKRSEAGIHPCFFGHNAWHLTSKALAARNRWTRGALSRLDARHARRLSPGQRQHPPAGEAVRERARSEKRRAAVRMSE